jgi:hypothetical protein
LSTTTRKIVEEEPEAEQPAKKPAASKKLNDSGNVMPSKVGVDWW